LTASSESEEAQESKEAIAKLTTALGNMHHFKAVETDEIYYFDEENTGVWVKGGERLIKIQCESMKPDVSTYEVNEVVNHIRRKYPGYLKDFDPQIEWLACKNCMINLKTLETRPHDSEFMATVQIPVIYTGFDIDEPNSKLMSDFYEWVGDKVVSFPCPFPKIMKFMHEVIADEDIETVLDFLAYSLWRAFPFHKYMFFNGSGRNGKGTMLELVKRLLGQENVSGESLERILETRFAAAELYGKLANIDADLSKEALKHIGTLKKLTGGDNIPAERKFERPFSFVNYAKLWFSANEMPITPDETDAFFARLIIVNFPNQFLGDKADPFLINKLATDDELSGLLRIVLKRLPKVLTQGIFVPSSTIGENYKKYIESSNPVRAFVETAIRQDSDSSPSKQDVYDSYKRFCTAKKLGVESEQCFNRSLKKEHQFNDIRVRDDRGMRQYHWVGIKIIDWMKVEGEEQGQSTLY
jgi:putative DNA primase/helicase